MLLFLLLLPSLSSFGKVAAAAADVVMFQEKRKKGGITMRGIYIELWKVSRA